MALLVRIVGLALLLSAVAGSSAIACPDLTVAPCCGDGCGVETDAGEGCCDPGEALVSESSAGEAQLATALLAATPAVALDREALPAEPHRAPAPPGTRPRFLLHRSFLC